MALEENLQLLAFSELYLSGYASDPGRVRQLAEPLHGPSLMRVADCAHREGVAIASPYAERARVAGEVHFYDAIDLVDATGTQLKTCCKTHLCNRSVVDGSNEKGAPCRAPLGRLQGLGSRCPGRSL